MHFVRQNHLATADEVPKANVDVMHYGPRAQMIHGEKRAHVSFEELKLGFDWIITTGAETCMLCAIK